MVCLCAWACPRAGAQVAYEAGDSLRVEELLRQAALQPRGTNMVLFFARQFVGTPYVGGTLEGRDPEQLVVNLRQLDCTTLVETVTALTLAFRHGQTRFADFVEWLRRLRYRDGVVDGYPSRLHYFSSWIRQAVRNGYVDEVTDMQAVRMSPFAAQRRQDIHFMSRNARLYAALAAHPEFVDAIRSAEKELTGAWVCYLPTGALGDNEVLRSMIHDGDILALVTKKDGLDVSHLGFAVWQTDGLHLLNASSLHHKVVLEPRTLQAYQRTQPSQLGCRVIRIK